MIQSLILKGMEAFNNKNYEQAYFLLKKALIKIKSENNVKLLLDCLFFIATLLSELQKYKVAHIYY